MADDFGELRSLLMGRPGEQAWSDICAILDTWPDEAVAERASYLAAHLKTWPDVVLRNPARWAKRAQREPVAGMRLVRTLALGAHRVMRPEAMARLRAAIQDSLITGLEVYGKVLAHKNLGELMRGLPRMLVARARFTRATLGLAGLDTLLSSPQTRPLAHLHISREQLGSWGVGALIESPRAAQLEALELVDASLCEASAQELLRSHALSPQRVALDHSVMPPTPGALIQGAAAVSLRDCDLHAHRHLPDFLGRAHEQIWLDDNEPGPREIAQLLAAGTLQAARLISLAGNPIGDLGVRQLVVDRLRCTHLDLTGCQLSDDAAAHLATRASSLEAIERLELRRNAIGARGWRALRASPLAERLVGAPSDDAT